MRLALSGAVARGAHQVGVYDLTGRLLRTAAFSGADYTLDLGSLPASPCFVKVTTGRTVAVQRLVVAK